MTYRVKSYEDLLKTPHIKVSSDGKLLLLYGTAMFKPQFAWCGKEVFPRDDGRFINEAPYSFPSWAVEEVHNSPTKRLINHLRNTNGV